ncbi:MAG: cysteine desulfurase family protein [Clostridia bacterium]|nr:cysteine desulfurase family protein [Clostridia bacterium]
MKKLIYLDNSATTKPCEKAIKNINLALNDSWANPSSLYDLGFHAQMLVDDTRKAVANVLRCREDEIYFTSGGTESNNTAILGAVYARKKRGNRIVTTAIEHPSVLETVRRLENEGFEVVYLKPQADGCVSESDIKSAINQKTILVSIMLVNNETGAIQPVKAASEAIKSAGAPALLHCDGVQAFGKMPINLSALGVDLFSLSAHKIHGPKGVGALYIKKGVTVKSLLTGGGQEKNLRSGTESVPLIYGLKGAVDSIGNINKNLEEQNLLWDYAKNSLLDTGLVKINSPQTALPYILNISVEGYRSETMLHFLEAQGVYVSSGSACAKGEGSYVLREMGYSQKAVDSALRISFSRFNTKDDIDALKGAICSATQKLRRAN